jgi:hypothetical protein
MTSTASPTPPLSYIDCDIPEGQTVVDWRRSRGPYPVRRARRRAVRSLVRRAYLHA